MKKSTLNDIKSAYQLTTLVEANIGDDTMNVDAFTPFNHQRNGLKHGPYGKYGVTGKTGSPLGAVKIPLIDFTN